MVQLNMETRVVLHASSRISHSHCENWLWEDQAGGHYHCQIHKREERSYRLHNISCKPACVYFRTSQLLSPADLLQDQLHSSTSPINNSLVILPESAYSTQWRKRRQIADIATWVQVYSTYMLVLPHFLPHQLPELIAYQLLIVLSTHHGYITTLNSDCGPLWITISPGLRYTPSITHLNSLHWEKLQPGGPFVILMAALTHTTAQNFPVLQYFHLSSYHLCSSHQTCCHPRRLHPNTPMPLFPNQMPLVWLLQTL